MQAISSVPRIYGRQVNRSKILSEIKTDEAEPGFDTKNKLDTRADTICEGENWRLLSALG